MSSVGVISVGERGREKQRGRVGEIGRGGGGGERERGREKQRGRVGEIGRGGGGGGEKERGRSGSEDNT